MNNFLYKPKEWDDLPSPVVRGAAHYMQEYADELKGRAALALARENEIGRVGNRKRNFERACKFLHEELEAGSDPELAFAETCDRFCILPQDLRVIYPSYRIKAKSEKRFFRDRKAMQMYRAGCSAKEICEKLDMSRSTFSRLKRECAPWTVINQPIPACFKKPADTAKNSDT